MQDVPEALDSWSVKIDDDDARMLIFTVNGRRIRMPPHAAELLGTALRARATEALTGATAGPSANDR